MALASASERNKGPTTPQRARPASRGNQRRSSVPNKQPIKSQIKESNGSNIEDNNSTSRPTNKIAGNGQIRSQPLPPVKVSNVNGGPRRPSENGSKVSNGLSGPELPNQPITTPVVQVNTTPVDVFDTSELNPSVTTASVKWKSTLSSADKDATKMNSQELIPLDLERNDSSLSGAGESPRNLLSAAGSHGGGSDRGKSPSERKLSLGDFVTETVQQTRQSPVKLETLESTNGLVNSLPYVPVSLAYVCLIMNIIIPGSGTILAGMSMMCGGEPRGQTKPDELFSQFTTNIFVGISQFFTVTFFLAGWIWSISWGVYLVLFAEENKLRKAEEEKIKKTAAIANTLWDR